MSVRILEQYPFQLFVATMLYYRVCDKRYPAWFKMLLCCIPMFIVYDTGIAVGYKVPYEFMSGMLMAIPVFYIVTALCLCLKSHLVYALFSVVAAYATQNIVYNIFWMIKTVAGVDEGTPISIIISLATMVVVYLIAYYLLAKRIWKGEAYDFDRIKLSAIAVTVILVASLLNPRLPESSDQFRIYAVYIFCDLLALMGQFGLFYESDLERRNMIMEQLLYEEQKKHQMTKENIELINRKCHDLKHQIAALRFMVPGEERDQYINEIENAVMIYDHAVKTGSDTLDLILMDKYLYCEKHHIKLSCVADGKVLNFIDIMDLYSLFGNALDNAIESVIQVMDLTKRVITLRVVQRGRLVQIHVENYTDTFPAFQDGLPVTQKKDKKYHGFGIMSIKHIAEKYQGTMNIQMQGNSFCMDVLIPLQEDGNKK